MKRPDGWIRVHGSGVGAHDLCPFSRVEDDSVDGLPARGHSAPFCGFPAGCGTRTCASRPLKSSSGAAGSPRGLFGEQSRLFPGREVAAPVGLVEVDEVGVELLDPARGARKISPGNVVKPTGSVTSRRSPAARAAACALPYERAAEAPVPVSQYGVMLSRMWSRVSLPEGCPPVKARRS